MSWAFLLQTLASAAAIAILVGFTAWARISRPPPKLDAAGALRVLADELTRQPMVEEQTRIQARR